MRKEVPWVFRLMKTPFAAVASDMLRVSIANFAGRNFAKTATIRRTRGALCPDVACEAAGIRRALPVLTMSSAVPRPTDPAKRG